MPKYGKTSSHCPCNALQSDLSIVSVEVMSDSDESSNDSPRAMKRRRPNCHLDGGFAFRAEPHSSSSGLETRKSNVKMESEVMESRASTSKAQETDPCVSSGDQVAEVRQTIT